MAEPEIKTPESSDEIWSASDADILNYSLPEETEETSETEESEDTSEEATEDTATEDEDVEEESDDSEETEDDEKDDSEETEDTADTEESDTEETDSDSDDTSVDETTDTTESTEEEDTSDAVDYKAEYEKLTAPFKANGVQMQIKSVDEAITLMQMGANYHKKMAGLKPILKTVKLLERNGLMDNEKINYLIDLYNKKPEAVTRLLKESGIDPMDIDVNADDNYKPESREVSDTEIELDNVLESIKETPTYTRTIDIITKQWDDNSRSIIAEAPHIIALINEHVANGIYDAINTVVTRERSLGRLQGMSDLEAYKAIGDQLHSQNQLPGQKPPDTKSTPKTTIKRKPSVSEKDRKKKKKGVSRTKTVTKTTTTPADFNPLALSDEEFEKQFGNMNL